MEFRIADTFTDSLARLTGDEQKVVKTTAFDLQLNPSNPGMRFHRLHKAKDKNFWAVRASGDLRLVVHRSPDCLLLCYVDHHDKAYDWAQRRKLETHPTTGAAQLVEIRERVKEVFVPSYVTEERTQPAAVCQQPLFSEMTDEALLGYGVPAEWLADVRGATEDSLLALADHLPSEAAEALLELAVGGQPQVPEPAVSAGDPFEHPDAQRRFRVMANIDELQRALDYPWEKWTVFLHPEQRRWVTRDYKGPARVGGSAGTGKTIVAIHRAAHLARTHSEARVLLTTFSDALANSLQTKLRRLLCSEPRLLERIDVYSLDALALRLYQLQFGAVRLAGRAVIRELIAEAATAVPDHRVSRRFLLAEWEQIVDAWQLESWAAYRDVPRLGRKTRLPERRRAVLWRLFERVQAELKARGEMTPAAMFTRLAKAWSDGENRPFDFAVVDEAQDIGVPHLRFFAALGGDRPNSLFFAGDLGQRIFQPPVSWLALGVDIRGRSRTLRVNYRTSHQIRMQADRLLDAEMSDADGIQENRDHTVSVFNGPSPLVEVFASEEDEIGRVGHWLSEMRGAKHPPHELAIFVRSPAQCERAKRAAEASRMAYTVLDEHVETVRDHLSISTMHLAKGLEFRGVVVMACDDEVLPLQERIENVGDDAGLEEVYDTERHLLYVACTRARDHLLVTGVDPASEFLDDLSR